jgi:hypothetical protein
MLKFWERQQIKDYQNYSSYKLIIKLMFIFFETNNG